ncbi:MAG TPA: hypothetical protein VEX11_12670 [Acetobacteraceae bacterium]|nr:hypothetical protein [Acetobacteraceae bacterium]
MARPTAAGVPEAVAFTKPKLGLAILDRASEVGVSFAWMTGDSMHGGPTTAFAVTSGQRLGFIPVEKWLAKVPPDGAPLSAADVLAAQDAVRRSRPRSPAPRPAPRLELHPDPALP